MLKIASLYPITELINCEIQQFPPFCWLVLKK